MTSDRVSETEPLTREAVTKQLLSLLATRLKASVLPHQNLFADGLITSMFAMELVVEVENMFGVAVEGRDLDMANFSSVNSMADLVLRLNAA